MQTIHISPWNIKCEIFKGDMNIEFEGRRGLNSNGKQIKIVVHCYSYFPHYLLGKMYEAITEEVKKVIEWKDAFRQKVQS